MISHSPGCFQRLSLTKGTQPGSGVKDGLKASLELKIRALTPNMTLPGNKMAASVLCLGGSSWIFTSPTPSRPLEVHHYSPSLARVGSLCRHSSATDYQPTEPTVCINEFSLCKGGKLGHLKAWRWEHLEEGCRQKEASWGQRPNKSSLWEKIFPITRPILQENRRGVRMEIMPDGWSD